jgi:hypothetical protein
MRPRDPYYSDAVWYLTQMRRWGQITEVKPDAWYVETVAKVYRPDLYLQSARLLVKEGKAEGGLGFPLGQRRLPRPAGEVHRRRRVRWPPPQRVPRPICDRAEERSA